MTEATPQTTLPKPVASEVASPPENVVKTEVSIRTLNPEISKEFAMGRAADHASLEAINPNEYSHDAMKDKELNNWLKGDDRNMTRFVIVDPEKFGEYVDLVAFHQAIEDARKAGDQKQVDALKTMEKEGILGFTYLYNHEDADPDFKRRAGVLREKMSLPEDREIREMNFWFVPGTKDAPVEQGARLTLTEFASTLTQEETTTVMFADSEDVTDTARELIEKKELTIETKEKRLSDRAILESLAANKDQHEKVVNRFQDTKVLKKLGFEDGGEMIYAKKDKLPSWMYFRTIFPNTHLTPPASPPPPTPVA